VTFSVLSGHLVAVIGPSGAGKSTLIKALTGTRRADAGTVRWDGRDLYADFAELRHQIGYVPQEDILHADLPARQALRYSHELHHGHTPAAERDRRVDKVIADLGLAEKDAGELVRKISGGSAKRVNIAGTAPEPRAADLGRADFRPRPESR
jgi:ABC transport system ATP-binding/permease protein